MESTTEGGNKEPQSTGAAKEQDREGQLRRYADTLGIPHESLSHETVRGFVGALVDLETVQLSLSETSVTRGGDEPEWNWIPGLRLTQRAALAGDLLSGEIQLLREGFRGAVNVQQLRKTVPGYYYDLTLTGENPAGDVPAEGVWRKPGTAPREAVIDFLSPRSRTSWRYDGSEHAQEVDRQAGELGIDPERVRNNVVLRGLLMDIVDARKLVATQEQAGSLPSAPGLTPSAPERLQRAAHVTRAAVMLLEDGFGGRRLEPKALAGELNQAYKPYGFQVGLEQGQGVSGPL